jgi:hypothetical protein
VTDVLLTEITQILVAPEDVARIVSLAEQGPPGPPGGGNVVQMRFAVTAAQADFVLPSNPVNGICLVSLNGVLQHEYVCLGSTMSIDPPAEAGDDVMITWWKYA